MPLIWIKLLQIEPKSYWKIWPKIKFYCVLKNLSQFWPKKRPSSVVDRNRCKEGRFNSIRRRRVNSVHFGQSGIESSALEGGRRLSCGPMTTKKDPRTQFSSLENTTAVRSLSDSSEQVLYGGIRPETKEIKWRRTKWHAQLS